MGGAESYERVSREYYEWLLDQVHMRRSGYSRLMKLLYETNFIPTLSRDANRESDGMDLKYRFAYERGYGYDYISETLECPCSMLEMMVALCIRCQEYIVVNVHDNQLSGDLFLAMLRSLRLDDMTDGPFNYILATEKIETFLAGYGPLFGVYDGRLRTEELWVQAMRHLNEMIFDRGVAL